jgi:hypothetical protein
VILLGSAGAPSPPQVMGTRPRQTTTVRSSICLSTVPLPCLVQCPMHHPPYRRVGLDSRV